MDFHMNIAKLYLKNTLKNILKLHKAIIKQNLKLTQDIGGKTQIFTRVPANANTYKLINGTGICYTARGGDQMGYFYIYLKPDKQDKVIGRDVFSLEFTRKNNRFKVYQLIQDSYKETDRTQYINGCVSENEYPIDVLPRVMICTFLIWNNNFKIPKDYPIKF